MPPVHWKSSDGAVERTLLSDPTSPPVGPDSGDGAVPVTEFCQPGARCRLETEVESDSPAPARLDLGDPAVTSWLSDGVVTVGEADTEVDRLLDRCLRTLRSGDRCQVQLRLRPDRLPASVSASGQREGEDLLLVLRLIVIEVSGGQPDTNLTQSERLSVAEACRKRGNELFSSGRDVDAIYRYRRALSLLAYILPPELEETERTAASAARLACRANLAAVLLRRGRHEAARAAASRVLTEQPDHVRCLYRRGAAHLALQDLEEAERDLMRVLKLDPGNAAAAKQMALLERRKRDLDQRTANFMTKYFKQ